MSRSHDNPNAQVVTEAVLVSGVSPWGGHVVDVTLTASRLVGAPVYSSSEKSETGDRLTFIFRQSSTGSYDITWNAIYVMGSVPDVGESATAVSLVEFVFDGTSWLNTVTAIAVVA